MYSITCLVIIPGLAILSARTGSIPSSLITGSRRCFSCIRMLPFFRILGPNWGDYETDFSPVGVRRSSLAANLLFDDAIAFPVHRTWDSSLDYGEGYIREFQAFLSIRPFDQCSCKPRVLLQNVDCFCCTVSRHFITSLEDIRKQIIGRQR